MARSVLIILILMLSSNAAIAATAMVIAVFDGDSLNVDLHGQTVRVKLYGIDAPESGQDGNVSAARFLRHLVLNRSVEVKVMGQDIFDRALAIITLEDQKFSVNARIVANGYAWVKPSECKANECVQMKKLESQARELKLGIWSGYDLVPPWNFKKHHKR